MVIARSYLGFRRYYFAGQVEWFTAESRLTWLFPKSQKSLKEQLVVQFKELVGMSQRGGQVGSSSMAEVRPPVTARGLPEEHHLECFSQPAWVHQVQ